MRVRSIRRPTPPNQVGVSMWTVYDKGTDGHADVFTARKWVIDRRIPEPIATRDVLRARDITALRDRFASEGMHRLARHAEDDPHIVEVWIV